MINFNSPAGRASAFIVIVATIQAVTAAGLWHGAFASRCGTRSSVDPDHHLAYGHSNCREAYGNVHAAACAESRRPEVPFRIPLGFDKSILTLTRLLYTNSR
jgi:hypothetical protein